ncbi:hypothetical protein ACQR3P_29245 [Rhodococcus sp. IEGM1300]
MKFKKAMTVSSTANPVAARANPERNDIDGIPLYSFFVFGKTCLETIFLVLISTELTVELLCLSREEGADLWHERCNHDDYDQREDEQG